MQTSTRVTTKEEKDKYYCSARKCKNTPVLVESAEIMRKNKKVQRVRYLCEKHKPKEHNIVQIVVPREEIAREIECELPRKPWIQRVLDWL
jgi:hypothetical protein